MKKIFAVAVAAAALSGAAFAQESESSLSFSNKVSSDIVTVDLSGGDSTGFAGITEQMTAEYKSEKVDFSIDLRVNLDDYYKLNSEGKPTFDGLTLSSVDGKWADGYLEFRPIPILTLYLNNGINTPGSYLPVEDDNVAAGNIGSDFGVCLRPIDGLRIAAGADVIQHIIGTQNAPDFNVGADYVLGNIGAIGFAVRGISSDLAIGGFFSLTAVENMTLNLGYGWYQKTGTFKDVAGNNLLNLGFTYGIGGLSLAADFVTNLMPKTDLVEDIYAGLNVGYAITEALGVDVTAQFQFDVVSEHDNAKAHSIIHIAPELTYAVGHNSFAFGVNLDFAEKNTLSFPVSWKWSL